MKLFLPNLTFQKIFFVALAIISFSLNVKSQKTPPSGGDEEHSVPAIIGQITNVERDTINHPEGVIPDKLCLNTEIKFLADSADRFYDQFQWQYYNFKDDYWYDIIGQTSYEFIIKANGRKRVRAIYYDTNATAWISGHIEFDTYQSYVPTLDLFFDGQNTEFVDVCTLIDYEINAETKYGFGDLTFSFFHHAVDSGRVPSGPVELPITYNTDLDTLMFDTLYIKVEDERGCTAYDSVKISTKKGPESGFISGNDFTCKGFADTLVLDTSVGNTYTWEYYDKDSLRFIPVSDPYLDTAQIVNHKENVEYRVKVEANGCQVYTDTYIHRVYELDFLVADILEDNNSVDTTEVCQNEDLHLRVRQLEGVNNTYVWTSSAGFENDSVSDVVYNNDIVQEEWKFVEITNDAGCTSTDSVLIITKPSAVPGIITTDSAVTCFGQEYNLQTFGNVGDIQWQVKYEGDWYPLVNDVTEINRNYFDTVHTYRIEVNRDGCIDYTEKFTQFVVDRGLPEIQINTVNDELVKDSILICENQEINLQAKNNVPNGATYKWSTPSASIVGLNTNFDCVIESSTNLTDSVFVQVIDADGCVNVDTVQIFNETRGFVGQIVAPLPACPRETITLEAINNQESITWFTRGGGNDSLLVAGANQFVGSFEEPYTQFFTVAQRGFCIDTSNFANLLIYPEVKQVSIDFDSTLFICEGTTINLYANLNDNIQWSTGETNDTIAVSETGFVSVLHTDPNGCGESIDSIEVYNTKSLNQRLSWFDAPDTVICGENESFVVQVVTNENTSSGFLTNWNNDTLLTQKSFVISETQQLFAKIEYNGCELYTDTVNFYKAPFNPKPRINSLTGTFFLCEDDSLQLSIAGSDLVYWGEDRNDVSSIKTLKHNEIVANDTLLYGYSENEFGCKTVSNIFRVKKTSSPAKPLINLIGDTTFCEGNSVTVYHNASEGYWFNDKSINTLGLTLDSTANIFFTALENTCTTNSDTLTVTMESAPQSIEIKGDSISQFCDGDTVSLSVVYDGSFDVIWDNDSSLMTDTISLTSNGVHSVKVSSTSGKCFKTATSKFIQFFDNPNKPTIGSITQKNVFCEGTALELFADANQGYWNGNENDTRALYRSTQSQLVYFTAVNDFGCIAVSDSFQTQEIPLPVVEVIQNDDNFAFCENDGTTLYLLNDSNYVVVWNDFNSTEGDSVFVNNVGEYQATIFDETRTCSVVTEDVFVRELEVPKTPVISVSNDTLYSNYKVADAHQWHSVLLGPLPQANDFKYFPGEGGDGEYFVVYTNSEGCSSTSDIFNFTYISVGENASELSVVLYPNPVNNGSIKVNSNQEIEGYQLLDLTGKVIMQGKLENAEINVSDVASGIYNLQLVSRSNETLLQRVVIK